MKKKILILSLLACVPARESIAGSADIFRNIKSGSMANTVGEDFDGDWETRDNVFGGEEKNAGPRLSDREEYEELRKKSGPVGAPIGHYFGDDAAKVFAKRGRQDSSDSERSDDEWDDSDDEKDDSDYGTGSNGRGSKLTESPFSGSSLEPVGELSPSFSRQESMRSNFSDESEASEWEENVNLTDDDMAAIEEEIRQEGATQEALWPNQSVPEAALYNDEEIERQSAALAEALWGKNRSESERALSHNDLQVPATLSRDRSRDMHAQGVREVTQQTLSDAANRLLADVLNLEKPFNLSNDVYQPLVGMLSDFREIRDLETKIRKYHFAYENSKRLCKSEGYTASFVRSHGGENADFHNALTDLCAFIGRYTYNGVTAENKAMVTNLFSRSFYPNKASHRNLFIEENFTTYEKPQEPKPKTWSDWYNSASSYVVPAYNSASSYVAPYVAPVYNSATNYVAPAYNSATGWASRWNPFGARHTSDPVRFTPGSNGSAEGMISPVGVEEIDADWQMVDLDRQ